MPYPPNLCTSVQSVGVFVGGYGIPAIPTPPSEFLPQNPFQVCLRNSSHRTHRIHRSFRRRIFSHRIHRNFRRRRASHGIHGIHRNFWRRIFSHRIHRIHRSFRRRIFSHRFHRFSQKFLAENILPQISQIFTEVSGGEYPPTDFTDFHRSRRVWYPCHTHAALRIPSTEPTPSLFAQVLPRNSQNSQKFLAEDILPRISQNTQKLLAEKSLPQISQMYTDFSSPPVVSVCSVNSVGR